MHIILLTYLIVGAGLFLLPKKTRKNKALFVALLQFLTFLYFIMQSPQVLSGEAVSFEKSWLPELGIDIQLNLDSLSLIFCLLITGIGCLVFLYAHTYMKPYKGTDKFVFYLTIFSGAMLGLVLSGNLIQLFIFWELTSVLSFLLISFFNEKTEARKAAFQSLFITGFGGLSLLAGIVLIGSIVESYALSDWVAMAGKIKQHQLYLPGLLLILLGAFTKSAQFPFHFWLPGAMQAPTPVSAYLHSATMVKAGIFLLARLSPVLAGTHEWTHIIPLFGALTMFVGAYLSVTQTDLKAILAYTTVSALGTLVLLLGIDTSLSVKAALLFLFVHAFYKASLFMVAGLIDKKSGTRNIDKLGALYKFMPITFAVVLLAALSMAGIPPMLGFLGKELIYEAKVQSPGIASLVLVFGVISNVLMVFVSLFFVRKVFLGQQKEHKNTPNEKGLLLLVGPIILVSLSMFFGLLPGAISTLIEPALSLIRVESVEVKLKLWHGFNDVLLLSMLTLLLGTLLLTISIRKKLFIHHWRKLNDKIFFISLSKSFTRGIEYFTAFSRLKARKVQHGYHRYYVLSIIVFTSILLWIQIFVTGEWKINNEF